MQSCIHSSCRQSCTQSFKLHTDMQLPRASAGFDPSTLQDLLPTIDEAGNNCATMYADPFDSAPLDASLWEGEAANPWDAHPWGSLSVDALFNMPGGSLPSSPLKAGADPSPFSSPLRAPGSPAPTTPAVAEASTINSAVASPSPAPATVPTVTSIPVVHIQTAHASSGAQDVVVIAAPRAAKRPAKEADGGGRVLRRRRTDGDESHDSDASAVSLEHDDIMPVLVAAPLGSQAQVCLLWALLPLALI